MLKSARKKFVSESIAKNFADRYTIVLKGINSYIKFINLNELEKRNEKKN